MNNLILLQPQKNGHYSLTGRLDRDTVPAFWQAKESWLPQDAKVVVDLLALERVDSAGMAMLLHFQQALVAKNQEVAFINIPPQLKTLMQLSNIDNFLNS